MVSHQVSSDNSAETTGADSSDQRKSGSFPEAKSAQDQHGGLALGTCTYCEVSELYSTCWYWPSVMYIDIPVKVGVGNSPGFQPCDLSDRTRLIFHASPDREQFLLCEIARNLCSSPVYVEMCWSVCIKQEKQYLNNALRIQTIHTVKIIFSALLAIYHNSVWNKCS